MESHCIGSYHTRYHTSAIIVDWKVVKSDFIKSDIDKVIMIEVIYTIK